MPGHKKTPGGHKNTLPPTTKIMISTRFSKLIIGIIGGAKCFLCPDIKSRFKCSPQCFYQYFHQSSYQHFHRSHISASYVRDALLLRPPTHRARPGRQCLHRKRGGGEGSDAGGGLEGNATGIGGVKYHPEMSITFLDPGNAQ